MARRGEAWLDMVRVLPDNDGQWPISRLQDQGRLQASMASMHAVHSTAVSASIRAVRQRPTRPRPPYASTLNTLL